MMPVPKKKPIEAFDGSYAGMVLGFFDEQEKATGNPFKSGTKNYYVYEYHKAVDDLQEAERLAEFSEDSAICDLQGYSKKVKIYSDDNYQKLLKVPYELKVKCDLLWERITNFKAIEGK